RVPSLLNKLCTVSNKKGPKKSVEFEDLYSSLHQNSPVKDPSMAISEIRSGAIGNGTAASLFT
ncbi:MAG: hypothetical protein GY820_47870, partial [Gammaproteobacteria bacterium]|nr:hypothetical protein [Gammaproteobacteria bacterium]